MSKTLLIKLQSIEIRNKQSYEYSYFSFSLSEIMYFSSCFDQKSQLLADDILIPLPDLIPLSIDLQRWQNHMIMFTHSIDITELKSRRSTKKRCQTKAGQILSFSILILSKQQLIYNHKFIKSISQHYLIISNIRIEGENKPHKNKKGPSFFIIKTSHSDAVLPVINGQICVKLPETLSFEQFKSGISMGSSEIINSDELRSISPTFPLRVDGSKKNTISMDLKWATNLQEAKPENNLLMEAHEILIYDMEVKFDNYNEFSNSKVKISYGNKGFEVGSEFSSSKINKVKKIIYFIIKSEEEEINIFVQKNLKIVSHNYFFTGDIQSYCLNAIKKKLVDLNGKQIGQIKFRAEKAKNLSTPLNNKFWKENIKKKTLSSAVLSIEQVSVNYKKDDDLSVVIKTQAQEWVIPDVPNFECFNIAKETSPSPVVINSKQQESIYIMVKEVNIPETREMNQSDFIGIGIINNSDLRMGINSVEIPCFKNQQKTVVINCLINKVIPYPFIKSVFQPQFLNSRNQKHIGIGITLKKANFTPYYYTYRYDKKNQVYCIVETNGVKKVLIMESSFHNELNFVPSAGSDSLSFVVDHAEFIKVKIVCLISDTGQEEEIYGSLLIKIKAEELARQPFVAFSDIELKNQYDTIVGYFDLQVMKKQIMDETSTERTSIRGEYIRRKKVGESRQSKEIPRTKKKDVNPIRNNHHSLDIKNLLNKSSRYEPHHESPKNYQESVKLPVIKESKKNSIKDLVQFMKVRKRGMQGYDETNTVEEYRQPLSDRRRKNDVGLQKIERQNPNLERNLSILFPKKSEIRMKEQLNRPKVSEYEEKLKGMKSVYNEISADMGEIEPTNKDSRELQEQNLDFHGVEWEGNEFAQQDHL